MISGGKDLFLCPEFVLHRIQAFFFPGCLGTRSGAWLCSVRGCAALSLWARAGHHFFNIKMLELLNGMGIYSCTMYKNYVLKTMPKPEMCTGDKCFCTSFVCAHGLTQRPWLPLPPCSVLLTGLMQHLEVIGFHQVKRI